MNTDINIINLVKKGDLKAFDILVVKYQDRLVYSVYKFCSDLDLSQDITQEAFVKAYNNIDKFRGDSSFYTWIYRIAINTAKNYFSNKSRGAETYNEDLLDNALSDMSLNSDNPETLLEAEEMKDAINQAFQNLPDEIRSTLSLREYDGLSYEEIAKVQNCPIGTVRSRIFKGRELINETFSKLGLSKTWSN
ncbi:MAG: sigma-70 family RNA polymerase sigma factor [Gammaproteobacteria bacterium]|jgi:RNA polymerase sigma-70 factor (ECF subfamily)|tara:strand:- start:160 stop:735 length:576 start_codon:yes stop_codon:yes gene_type:complete